MQRRRRSWRRSWPLNNTEPVASNFYPITSAATLRGIPPQGAPGDDDHGGGGGGGGEFELSLVTDRPQGAASLESGAMHVLLHRRLLTVRDACASASTATCGCHWPPGHPSTCITRGQASVCCTYAPPVLRVPVLGLHPTLSECPERRCMHHAPGRDKRRFHCAGV